MNTFFKRKEEIEHVLISEEETKQDALISETEENKRYRHYR